MTMGILEDAFTAEAEDAEFLVVKVFRATFHGHCTLDPWHKIRRNDLIGRVVRGDNPFVPLHGYACAACVHSYPRVEE